MSGLSYRSYESQLEEKERKLEEKAHRIAELAWRFAETVAETNPEYKVVKNKGGSGTNKVVRKGYGDSRDQLSVENYEREGFIHAIADYEFVQVTERFLQGHGIAYEDPTKGAAIRNSVLFKIPVKELEKKLPLSEKEYLYKIDTLGNMMLMEREAKERALRIMETMREKGDPKFENREIPLAVSLICGSWFSVRKIDIGRVARITGQEKQKIAEIAVSVYREQRRDIDEEVFKDLYRNSMHPDPYSVSSPSKKDNPSYSASSLSLSSRI